VNLLNADALYSVECVKWYILCYIYQNNKIHITETLILYNKTLYPGSYNQNLSWRPRNPDFYVFLGDWCSDQQLWTLLCGVAARQPPARVGLRKDKLWRGSETVRGTLKSFFF
jgi:hypothetical protein